MIDAVLLKTKNENIAIDKKIFTSVKNRKKPYYYRMIDKNLYLRYYPDFSEAVLCGKLSPHAVENIDDLYGIDYSKRIDELSGLVSGLLRVPVDLLLWEPCRIDFCFNVRCSYVSEYVSMLETAFSNRHSASRTNFTKEKGLTGSVYIKTKSDFNKKSRTNYVLNFYNKADYIEKNKEKGICFSPDEVEKSKNIFRCEVQTGKRYLNELSKKIGGGLFGDYCKPDVAFSVLSDVYCRVFGGCYDFYSFAKAKSIFPSRSMAKNRKSPADAVLNAVAHGHDVTDGKYAHGLKLLRDAGIYPFAFVPKGAGVDYMPCPVTLVAEKINALCL